MLLLFDIDGTLIHSGGAGGAALMAAFTEEFGIRDDEGVPFSGRTDRGIVQSLLHKHGLEDSADHFVRLRTTYLRLLVDYLPRRAGRVLPGVLSLLESLRQAGTFRLGLLTGNVSGGARLKLEFYKLYHYFEFGAYGDDHLDRDDVARAALTEATTLLEQESISGEQIWIVGDTPLDIRCARAIDARAVAVATGIHSRDELAESEPDLLLDDLSDPEALLSVLEGPV